MALRVHKRLVTIFLSHCFIYGRWFREEALQWRDLAELMFMKCVKADKCGRDISIFFNADKVVVPPSQ
jgi:hypothetical protein